MQQAKVTVHGHGKLTTPAFNTVASSEVLLAFVGSDGPNGASKQTVTVTGGGLTWKLVKRANGQPGDSEIWSARAANPTSGIKVSSTPLKTGYDQDLTVLAYEGTSGVGASATSSTSIGAAPPLLHPSRL